MVRKRKDGDEGETELTEDLANEEAPPETLPAPVPATEPPPAAVEDAPLVTLASFARRQAANPLMQAFMHLEQLHRPRVVKLPARVWQAKFDAFVKEPR